MKSGAGELNQYVEKTQGLVSPERTRHLRHGYAACVSYIDAQIGRLLDELDMLGIRDSTIVVLWSDHGYKLGEFSAWAKHTNFELDTRVPLIVSVPGLAKGRAVPGAGRVGRSASDAERVGRFARSIPEPKVKASLTT